MIKPLSMRNTLQSSYLSLGDEAFFFFFFFLRENTSSVMRRSHAKNRRKQKRKVDIIIQRPVLLSVQTVC